MNDGDDIRLYYPFPGEDMAELHEFRLRAIIRNLTALIQECIDEED